MWYLIRRSFSTAKKVINPAHKLLEINLAGRDYIIPKNLTALEIKSLLWTALDLKYLTERRCNLQINSVKNRKVALILDAPCIETQVAINNAASILNVSLSVVVDFNWNKAYITEDYGRMLSASSDIIFCTSHVQNKISELADGAKISVVAVKSDQFTLLKTLADLMTLQLHFDYLKPLTIGWIGLPCPAINSLMNTMPRLGINMKYFCPEKRAVVLAPALIQEALKYSQKNNTEIHQCDTVQQAIYRSDVIMTAIHDDPDLCIKMKDVKEASFNWAFLHSLPRSCCEVDKEVFEHKNSLVWKSVENLQWIYAAIILRFLSGYSPVTNPPDFEKMDFYTKL